MSKERGDFHRKVVGVEKSDRIIVALDLPSGQDALNFLKELDRRTRLVKVGPALFIREGPNFVRELESQGYRVFLDLKLHDIPNTVALGVRSARELGVWMLSVHLSGGPKMLEAAFREAGGSPILAGITVLTSLDEEEARKIGMNAPIREQVQKLSKIGVQKGIGAIVASPKEIPLLRSVLGPKIRIITPGIRLPHSPPDDQSRTMPPKEAVEAGSDYLVIGRPLLQAANPREVLDSILVEIEERKPA